MNLFHIHDWGPWEIFSEGDITKPSLDKKRILVIGKGIVQKRQCKNPSCLKLEFHTDTIDLV